MLLLIVLRYVDKLNGSFLHLSHTLKAVVSYYSFKIFQHVIRELPSFPVPASCCKALLETCRKYYFSFYLFNNILY